MGMGFTWQGNPPEQLLTEHFAIETGFHPGQREIIEQLVQGRRVLAIQRTGWGKSLCYQMASLYFPYLTIVFSPLKALMRDQCQRCNAVGLGAGIISSDFSGEENRSTLEKARTGNFKILFIAPERLDNVEWQACVPEMRISMVVVDEAHCISTWGHDFRPHYRQIARLLLMLPTITSVLALTATANERVERDILQQIGDPLVIRGSMQRPNLYVNVVRLNGDWEKLCYLGEVLPHRSDVGIVYTATQSSATMVATFLRLRGMKTEYYHAGREGNVRRRIEQELMANYYNVICSTTALGMGIDKPDIRFVIHYHVPPSPIHYYQEMGRAGRDGNLAWCILLYDPADIVIHEHLHLHAKPPEQQYNTVLSLLHSHVHGLSERDILLATGLSKLSVRNIIADLEEQSLIEANSRSRRYMACIPVSSAHDAHDHKPIPSLRVDFSSYAAIQQHKHTELLAMQEYAHGERCYMEYLIACLGDHANYRCGTCGYCCPQNFPPVKTSERIQLIVTKFLEEEFLPCIEMRYANDVVVHEAGWALAYHKGTPIGRLVSLSKYRRGGPFALGLVMRAVEIVRTRYPIQIIEGVVSVPPTQGSMLVEMFARQVAERLGIIYLPILVKARTTEKQKRLTNSLQKMTNVIDAFNVLSPDAIRGRTLLLIDDIFDSGYTLYEVGKALMRTEARAVYPFTITRTAHSDDQ